VIDDLLMIAEELVDRESGRPRQASLRRAAATAYYAVFHALAKLCADQLIGYSKPWDVYTPVYRTMDHGAARRAFERARKGSVSGGAVETIGLAFVNLQDARIEADYVPEPFKYSRREVKDLIMEARSAIAAIETLPAETRLQLAVLFLTRTR
jgi:hypothetical protein